MTGACGSRRNPEIPGHPIRFLRRERDYFLERRYPRFGNLAPRDVASRAVEAYL